MAWCLTAPSHYLNQCWLLTEILPEGNFTGISPTFILYDNNWKLYFKNYCHIQESFCVCTQPMRNGVTFLIIGWVHTQNNLCTSPRGQWVNCPREACNLGPISLRCCNFNTSQFIKLLTPRKMHILQCVGSNFVWNFKGHIWNFAQNFGPIHLLVWNIMVQNQNAENSYFLHLM